MEKLPPQKAEQSMIQILQPLGCKMVSTQRIIQEGVKRFLDTFRAVTLLLKLGKLMTSTQIERTGGLLLISGPWNVPTLQESRSLWSVTRFHSEMSFRSGILSATTIL